MYYDRIEAGFTLAKALSAYKGEDCIILAVPRGGVPVAWVVAKELGCPLDLLLIKKIGHPMNKEYAIGAVSMSDRFIVPHGDVSQAYIDEETGRIRQRLQEMYQKFTGGREPLSIKGKTVIIIDDGIATGNTLMSSINMLRKSNPAKIVIAVPVAPQSSIEKLSLLVDDVICPMVPDIFFGVGGFYQHFHQVSDEEVMEYMAKAGVLEQPAKKKQNDDTSTESQLQLTIHLLHLPSKITNHYISDHQIRDL